MKREEVRAKLMEIWEEVGGLPIDGSFSGGSRGHLKITIANAMKDLGLGEPWMAGGEDGREALGVDTKNR